MLAWRVGDRRGESGRQVSGDEFHGCKPALVDGLPMVRQREREKENPRTCGYKFLLGGWVMTS